MSGMRTVSLLGPEADGIGTGRTEADNGRAAPRGFDGGKKFVDEMSGVADAGEDLVEAPVSRTGNWMRTVSCGLAPMASLQAEAATGCEPSLSSVGQVRPSASEKLTRNR